jgi:teichuronic acid biosynthesis glycosyltransferase TuaG
MKISVIIPAYNAAKTIVTTIQSILNQSYPACEIIVVDDCSTDNSTEIVRQHFKDEVILITLCTNAGPSTARNRGWDYASGEYVAFVDADDQWHREKLAICAKALAAKPSTELLWHHYQTEKLAPISMQHMPNPLPTKLRHLLLKNPVSSSAIILKNIAAIRFDDSMRFCEDYKLAMLAAQRGYAYQLPLALTQIGRPILSKGGLSSQKLKMRIGEMRCYCYTAQLNPFYLFLLPLLLLWSSLKHLRILINS